MSDHCERLSVAQERCVDSICAQFEAAFDPGAPTPLDAFLPGDQPELWPRLREELAALDDELRRAAARSRRDGQGPERIGGYRIVRRIGQGGMGTVYEAVQEATRQRVALKVVRADLRGERIRRRFEREVRLLGHLHHPGIAQLFDAGVDESGEQCGSDGPVPYLVMELLHGQPLLAHAEQQQLDVRGRLELVRRVCVAVQHAHDQGIVHRDLKPANILVEPEPDAATTVVGNAVGSPKVLDFGVARAVSSERDLHASVDTHTSQIVGTMSHMSPEQLGGDPDLVDARADVYALGVILYELLAGRLPHEVKGQSLASAIERVRTHDPVLLGRLDARLRGDVEVIVQKAMEKDPAQRYQRASALAEDLARHLDDLPIRARPATTVERVRKFARRNRGLFQGLVAAVTVLVVSLVVVAVFAYRQACLREQAEISQRIESAVSGFLKNMLRRANLDSAGNTRDTRLYDVLVAAEAEVDGAFAEDPASRAAVRVAIGNAFNSQGEFTRAEAQFRAACDTLRAFHGESGRDLMFAEKGLALALQGLDRLEQSEQLWRQSLVLARGLEPADAGAVADVLNDLATCVEQRGALDEAIGLHHEALELRVATAGPASLEASFSYNNLGAVLESKGDFAGAEAMYRRAIEIRRAQPKLDRSLATAINNLAVLVARSGRLRESLDGLEEALRIRTEVLGPDHPHTLAIHGSLASLRHRLGEPEAAVAIMRELIPQMSQRLGDKHLDVLVLRGNLVHGLLDTGHVEEALAVSKELVDAIVEVRGEDHEQTRYMLGLLTTCLEDSGELRQAREVQERRWQSAERSLGDHESTAMMLAGIGQLASRAGDVDADELLRRAVAQVDRHPGRAGRDHIQARIWLLGHLIRQGAAAEDEAGRLAADLRTRLDRYTGVRRESLIEEFARLETQLSVARAR